MPYNLRSKRKNYCQEDIEIAKILLSLKVDDIDGVRLKHMTDEYNSIISFIRMKQDEADKLEEAITQIISASSSY